MTIIALLSDDRVTLDQLAEAFARQAPEAKIALPGEGAFYDAEVAACWYPPPGSLGAMPRLRLIHSIGAGVDHLDHDPTRPMLPVCRVVDEAQVQGMVEYVRWTALYYHRGFDKMRAQQQAVRWCPPMQREAGDYHIGVMGLGVLGAAVAKDLAGAGYAVRGWARSAKNLPGIDVFNGPERFNDFLIGLDLLVNLLPLTAQTRAVLNMDLFGKLNPGAAVVNCGRGAHMVAKDVIAALACGQLGGAVLDVFETEPLPASDPLWRTSGVVLTPHMASSAATGVIVRQIIENARRVAHGEVLLNEVDRTKGY